LPLIKEIQGRTTDFVIAMDGTVMHGLALVYIVRDLPGIAKFKIVQNTIEYTKVFLVAGANFDRANTERIRSAIRQRLGAGVTIDVELVDNIPAEASGKYRYVVSKAVAPKAEPASELQAQ
jgi:phenylacetate-CoA ligase